MVTDMLHPLRFQEAMQSWQMQKPETDCQVGTDNCAKWLCCCYTYIIVNITAEALTCSESIVSAGRLHTNYQKHRFSCCPRAIIHMSQVGSFRALWASAPLKWQLRWRGTNTKRRHRWQRTRKPLYLPCCHSMVHWGWNSMWRICSARAGVCGMVVRYTM